MFCFVSEYARTVKRKTGRFVFFAIQFVPHRNQNAIRTSRKATAGRADVHLHFLPRTGIIEPDSHFLTDPVESAVPTICFLDVFVVELGVVDVGKERLANCSPPDFFPLDAYGGIFYATLRRRRSK